MPTNPTKRYALTNGASVIVVISNPTRKFVAFANPDAANLIYISNSQQDTLDGFPVMPRSYIGFESTSDKIDVTQPIWCYCAAANLYIHVIEGYYQPEYGPRPKPPPYEKKIDPTV